MPQAGLSMFGHTESEGKEEEMSQKVWSLGDSMGPWRHGRCLDLMSEVEATAEL